MENGRVLHGPIESIYCTEMQKREDTKHSKTRFPTTIIRS